MILLMALASAVALALLAGGSVREVEHASLAWLPLVWIALAARFVASRSEHLAVQMVLWLVVYGSIVLFAVRNSRHQPGFLLLVLGVVANIAAIVANGGMPLHPTVASRLRLGTPLATSTDPLHVVAADPSLSVLTDLLPLRFASSSLVLSIGDALMGIGVLIIVLAAMSPSGASMAGGGTQSSRIPPRI